MKTTSKFGVYTEEPKGTTFEPGTFPKLAGDSNTKRKGEFGVMNDEPQRVTFQDADEFEKPLHTPDASKAKLVGVKTIHETAGQGMYEPDKAGGRLKPNEIGGSISVGKNSPKKGREMRTSQEWRK